MTKKQRKKVYERVSKRYRRLAKKLGQNWKEIEINGLRFEDAYKNELWTEEYNQQMGHAPSKMKQDRTVEERGFSPEAILKEIESEEEIPRKKSNTFIDEEFLGLFRGETPEQRGMRKQIEKVVNKMLEEQATKDICPICKSSVCHCPKEGETENVD